MNVPELALHHQRLDRRAAALRGQVARLEAELAQDRVAERLDQERATVDEARRDVELRLLQRERDAEERRVRLRARERDLMSGRIRNPTELLKLNHEVEALRGSVGEVEDAQLELMETQESLQAELNRLAAELATARERTAAAAPELRARLERTEADLAATEAERDATWASLPAEWQQAYERVRSRVPDPIAEAAHGQCQACRVQITSSGMQVLRRGGLLQCDNCGRILVAT
jgi:predicted  nucleic acid-binding Zn-ribbon protein